MTLRDDILANPACADAIAARDCDALAAIASIGRTRSNDTMIGVGTVLETLGVDAGNAFLDVLNSAPAFRHVRLLVQAGTLHIGKPLVQYSVQAMVPADVLTQAQADALCALGIEPHPYTVQEVAEAMFNPDGSAK